MSPSNIDIFNPSCDAIECEEDAKYERDIKVRDRLGQPFIFTAFFCERHKNEAQTPWDDHMWVE